MCWAVFLLGHHLFTIPLDEAHHHVQQNQHEINDNRYAPPLFIKRFILPLPTMDALLCSGLNLFFTKVAPNHFGFGLMFY